jgi:hypothetical protein
VWSDPRGTLEGMSQAFKLFLDMGDTRAIASRLVTDGTHMTSDNGAAAQTACIILTVEKLETTIRALDDAATRLQQTSLRIAGWSLVVAVLSMAVAVVAIIAAG